MRFDIRTLYSYLNTLYAFELLYHNRSVKFGRYVSVYNNNWNEIYLINLQIKYN